MTLTKEIDALFNAFQKHGNPMEETDFTTAINDVTLWNDIVVEDADNALLQLKSVEDLIATMHTKLTQLREKLAADPNASVKKRPVIRVIDSIERDITVLANRHFEIIVEDEDGKVVEHDVVNDEVFDKPIEIDMEYWLDDGNYTINAWYLDTPETKTSIPFVIA